MIKPKIGRILLVDDEEGIRFTLGTLLRKEGYHVDVASCHAEAIEFFQTACYDLAFVDVLIGGDSGIDVLRDIKAISPATAVVIFTGAPEVETAAAAIRLGAYDYIFKPVNHITLFSVARHALSARQMNDKLEQYRNNMDAILRTVPDAIIMTDKEGCLIHFNAAAEKICGFNSSHIGMAVSEISLGFGRCFSSVLLETISNNLPREVKRIEHVMSGYKSRIFSFTSTPLIEAHGAVSGAVAVIRDETHLVELEHILLNRGQFYGIIGASAPMQRIYTLVEALADVQTTVLINGENGTGKELVAAALHAAGSRAQKPFVKVNCSALSESLLESELFGHVRGAFTGAIADKVGRFQRADGGTLFLDEIGDISPTTQMRLLRVLQEREFERVGETKTTKVDVRIVTATNQNLEEKIRQGTFRKDLYYRLNVVRIVLPALRDRMDDLEPLIAHFISKYNSKLGKSICGVTDDVLAIFRSHTWPGNVRELEHAIEHGSVLCKTDVITKQNLPLNLIDSVQPPMNPVFASISLMPSPQNKLTMEDALDIAGGNRSRAAEMLGISRSTLYRHLGQE